MKFQRLIACILIGVLFLSACSQTAAPQAPDETLIQKDISDYITEILDSSASIIAFEKVSDSCSGSKATAVCEVTYRGDKGEYTVVFSLEYHFSKGTWNLEKCSLELTGNPGGTTQDPASTEDTIPSTDPRETDPPETEHQDTKPVQTETTHRWKISHSSKTLLVGESFKLQVTNQNGTVADVSWQASKSGIVSISGNRIAAVSEGKTELTCTIDGQSFRCVVTVKAKTVDPTDDPTTDTTPPIPTDDTTPDETTEPTCPPLPDVTPDDDPIEDDSPSLDPPPNDTEPTEPQGKAPSGYSIRLSPKEVYVLQTFYVTVTPDVEDYTKIVIHAIDPTGGTWDFVITSGNSYDLMVTEMHLTGTWTIYADVYNDYGVFRGSSSGAKAYLTVYPLPI